MCSGFEAGSHSRLIDSVYHSTLGLSISNKKKKRKKKNVQILQKEICGVAAAYQTPHPHPRIQIDEVPRGDEMLLSVTDLESYITECTLVYEDNPETNPRVPAGEFRDPAPMQGQWLQRHPEAGSSWPSWPKGGCST